MNFVADECCDAHVVAGLRGDGHDVYYVVESAPGATDESVIRLSASEERILLTEDKDFGELIDRLGLSVFGVVLLRINLMDSDSKLTRLREVMQKHGSRLPGSFVVIERRKTRLRPLHRK